MSDSVRPHGLQPTRLLHPWDFPGTSTGASIRKMSKQVSLGSAGEYQADEGAGVARLSWRVSVNCDEALCVASRIWFRILSVLCRVCGCCGKAPVCRNVPRCSGVDPFHISNGTINYIVNYINN